MGGRLRVRQRRYLPHVGEINVCEVNGPQGRGQGRAGQGRVCRCWWLIHCSKSEEEEEGRKKGQIGFWYLSVVLLTLVVPLPSHQSLTIGPPPSARPITKTRGKRKTELKPALGPPLLQKWWEMRRKGRSKAWKKVWVLWVLIRKRVGVGNRTQLRSWCLAGAATNSAATLSVSLPFSFLFFFSIIKF